MTPLLRAEEIRTQLTCFLSAFQCPGHRGGHQGLEGEVSWSRLAHTAVRASNLSWGAVLCSRPLAASGSHQKPQLCALEWLGVGSTVGAVWVQTLAQPLPNCVAWVSCGTSLGFGFPA